MGKNLQRPKIIEDGERGFASLLLVSELQRPRQPVDEIPFLIDRLTYLS